MIAKAKLIYRNKVVVSEDTICDMVIWKLPSISPERPHGLKYRLHFGDTNGKCLVRYDNEHGKGDHRHYYNSEQLYEFTTVEQLLSDFLTDVKAVAKQEGLSI